MIIIERIKIFNDIPIYKVSSNNRVTIKKVDSNKEYAFINSITEPNLKDYVECITSIESYNLKKKYDERVKELIHEEYTTDDEIQLSAEQDTNKPAWDKYRNYVKDCKKQAHQEIYNLTK